MRPIKLNISFSQLIAEFFIVFVGVAIALAADDWRGDRQERDRELVGFITHLRLLNNITTSINSVNASVDNIQEAVTAELAVRGTAVGPED